MASRKAFKWTLERSRALLIEAVLIPKVMSSNYNERTAARADLLKALKKRTEFKDEFPDKHNAVSNKLDNLVESLVGKRLPGWTARKTDTSTPSAFRVESGKEDADIFKEMRRNAQSLFDYAVLASQSKAADVQHEKWETLTKKLQDRWTQAEAGGWRNEAWMQLSSSQRESRVRLATSDLCRMPESELWDENGEAILPQWAAWNFEDDAPVVLAPDENALATLEEELAAKKRKIAEECGAPPVPSSPCLVIAEALKAAVVAAASRALAPASAPAHVLAPAPHQTCTAAGCDCLFTRDQLLAHQNSVFVVGDGKMVCSDCRHRVALHP